MTATKTRARRRCTHRKVKAGTKGTRTAILDPRPLVKNRAMQP
jgi:hypothetical protein